MENFNNNIRKIIEKQFEEAARMEDIRQKRVEVYLKAWMKKFEEDLKNMERWIGGFK